MEPLKKSLRSERNNNITFSIFRGLRMLGYYFLATSSLKNCREQKSCIACKEVNKKIEK